MDNHLHYGRDIISIQISSRSKWFHTIHSPFPVCFVAPKLTYRYKKRSGRDYVALFFKKSICFVATKFMFSSTNTRLLHINHKRICLLWCHWNVLGMTKEIREKLTQQNIISHPSPTFYLQHSTWDYRRIKVLSLKWWKSVIWYGLFYLKLSNLWPPHALLKQYINKSMLLCELLNLSIDWFGQ